ALGDEVPARTPTYYGGRAEQHARALPARDGSHAGRGGAPDTDLRDDADAAGVRPVMALARPPARHRLAVRGLSRPGGRGALPGGDRACQGRSAVGTVHAGAGHERVARARGPVADAAAAGGRAGDGGRASRTQAAAAGPGHALAAGYGNDGRRRSVPPTRLRCSHTTATSSRTRSRSCS